MNPSYSPSSSQARWQRRFSTRWPTTTIRSPYKDRPEWVVTEAQQALLHQIAAIPEMSERQRAAMLGMSPKMVHHNITVWLERGLLRIVSKGLRGVKRLLLRSDWSIGQLTQAIREKFQPITRRHADVWRRLGQFVETLVDERRLT